MKVAVRLLLVLASTAMMTASVFDREIFPAEVHGWMLAPEAETFTGEDLFKYIDGASELYISYGFTQLHARRYVKAGQAEITVDLFEMNDAGSAFGIFAHSQERPGCEVGQQSEYLDGLLRFRQGKYYVSLLCSPETPQTRAVLLELGKRMAARLPAGAERPPALSLLPEPGLIASSIRYFSHHAWQNAYQFVAADNMLEIGPKSQAILAKYDQGGQRPVVLLVLYSAAAVAGRAYTRLGRRFDLPGGEGTALRLADGKYFAAAVEGSVLAAVWHSGGEAPALQLLAALREKAAAKKTSGRQE